MLEKWTGEVVGTMHIYGISSKELAKRMNIAPQYLSAVLNGKKKPNDIEFRTRQALNELMREAEAVGCRA